MESTKQCTKCNRTLPISAFGKHRHCKDGLNPECKECNAKRSKKWTQTPSGIYTLLKSRQAFFRKKPVILSRESFIVWYEREAKKCHYCDIDVEDLHLFAERYGSRYSRLTVDCKDNDKGYVAGNLVLACDKCNITKNNMLTYEEMLYVGQNFIKPKWKALKKLKG